MNYTCVNKRRVCEKFLVENMKNLRRDPIKFVRDKAKARYNKGTECEICGIKDNLDFHHYYTLTPLFNKWLKSNGITINTDDEILAVRDRFIAEHEEELYVHTVTLCHEHHMKLHSIYGKDPPLHMAQKEMRWVQLQRQKHLDKEK